MGRDFSFGLECIISMVQRISTQVQALFGRTLRNPVNQLFVQRLLELHQARVGAEAASRQKDVRTRARVCGSVRVSVCARVGMRARVCVCV